MSFVTSLVWKLEKPIEFPNTPEQFPMPAIKTEISSSRAKKTGGAPGRPPAPMDEVSRRVIDTASEQYMRLGFSAVTTDETARAAGISKKTLYQLFPSKDELLRNVVRENCEKHTTAIRGICRDAHCSIGKRLKRMMNYLSKVFGELSPALVHDLRRSAPGAWNDVEKNRQRCIQEDFGALLKEGRERGDFRKDVDPRIFMLIYAETVRNVINPQVFAQLDVPPARVFETVYKVLFEGMLTEKARKEYT
ncbi:MAG: Transcriptional regulator [Fibrobacteria bacterium]|nr:Transcriptional regulator [Fibrobacteria bacterium]